MTIVSDIGQQIQLYFLFYVPSAIPWNKNSFN